MINKKSNIKKNHKNNHKNKSFIGAFFIFIILILMCFPAASCAGDEVKTDLIEEIKYGVVEVEMYNPGGGAKTYGSGFIVSANTSDSESASGKSCVIITNYHVTEGLYPRVRFFGEDGFTDAVLRGYNEDFDVAVLVVGALPDKYHVFNFDSAPVLGGEVLSLGFVSHRLSVYDGLVSVKDKWIKVDGDWFYVFETTAVAPEGTSGGVCVDKNGNLIGLNCYNYSLDGLLGGISYKVPSPVVAAIYDRIMNSEAKVSNPALWLAVYDDYITVTAFGKGAFDVYLSAAGLLKIKNSANSDFKDGATVHTVNGREVDFCAFMSEIILTGKETQIVCF